MIAPKYHDIRAEMVPKLKEHGCKIGIISGKYKGLLGAVQGDNVKMLFLDVDMKPGAHWRLETIKDLNLFIYIVEGKGFFEDSDDNLISSKSAVLFNNGEELLVRASENGMRLLLFSAKQLNEPIAWGGPIVMNTQEELKKAFKELDEGTFIK